MRLMAYTPCYRREAGSAGRDTRGMLRAHEFDKVEILAYATPEQAPGHARRADRPGPRRPIAALGLPYRIIEICTGDLGQSHHRSFDIEVYAPGVRPVARGRRRSAGSATTRPAGPTSATGRAGEQGHRASLHTLNGSALAVPRVWAAIVENYRQPDGSIAIPEVLWPYMRGHREIPVPAGSSGHVGD